MSNFQVGGPTIISVGTGNNGVAQFVGYTEASVRVSEDVQYEEIFADISGGKIPIDVQFMGTQAFITADFVLWNEGVMNSLRAKARGNTTGAINGNYIGGLMGTQDLAHALWIYRPYSTLPAFSSTQNTGYHFPFAFPIDAWELETGTKTSKIRCIWRALPLWDTGTGSAVLYDTNMTGAITSGD